MPEKIEKCFRCHKPCEAELYLEVKGKQEPLCQKCCEEMTDEELDALFENKTSTPAAIVSTQRKPSKNMAKKHEKPAVAKNLELKHVLQTHGKEHKITIRISPKAAAELRKVAKLFGCAPGRYMKALLYWNLGLFDEVMDRRKQK